MATRTISTRLTIDGEKAFKQEMSQVNSQMKTLASEMALAEAEFKGQANSVEYLTKKDKLLREEVEQQEEKVRALEGALSDSAEAYGENDKKTDGYRQQLNRAKAELIKLNDELDDNAKYLDEAKDSADRCAKSIDGFGKEVKDAGQQSKGLDLKGLIGDLGNLKSALMGGAAVAGLKELGSAIIGIVEDTEEYRKVMGTLEVSSEAAGYTAEQTAQAYTYLQGVLGDTQAAATTVANLQAIGLEQKDLMTLVEAATGAWATYGDSIPIDGLSESINETIQAGKVTGTFADVLNWAGVSEDDFNAKLEAATSSTERAQLVLDQLSSQGLPETARSWRDANGDLIAYNESQEKLDNAMGELGEVLAPVAAGLKSIFAEGVYAAADAVGWLIDKVSAAVDWLKKLDEKISSSSGWKEFTNPTRDTSGETAAAYEEYLKNFGGSHADGLYRVPYDGYIAELHEGERVLTANEAGVYNALERYGSPAVGGVTANELRATVAQAVNALDASDRPLYVTVQNTMKVNGRELYRETIDDLRAVARANPELGGEA